MHLAGQGGGVGRLGGVVALGEAGDNVLLGLIGIQLIAAVGGTIGVGQARRERKGTHSGGPDNYKGR